MDALGKCQEQMKNLKRLEYRRYPDSSYGTFEKTRRCFLVNDMDEILKKFESLMSRQKNLLKLVGFEINFSDNINFYYRQEYDFHDSQLTLLNSSLNESPDDRERRAGRFMHSMRQ